MEIVPATDLNENEIKQLASLLRDAVACSALLGHCAPMDRKESIEYWRAIRADVLRRRALLFTARARGQIAGALVLELPQPSDGMPEAHVARTLVHDQFDREGVAAQLLQSAERMARAFGRTLRASA